jgi:hypothetical protein
MGGALPDGLKLLYKAKKGSVELVYPKTDVALLKQVLEDCSHDSRIIAKQTGKSSCFLIYIEPISDFVDHAAAQVAVNHSLHGVRDLLAFYQANADRMTAIWGE